jgi:hypothetical protein
MGHCMMYVLEVHTSECLNLHERIKVCLNLHEATAPRSQTREILDLSR